jgi:hypothetical protein
MTAPVLYLLDTHAIYWHLIASPKLSAPAAAAIASATTGSAVLIFHHIALAELFWLLRKQGQSALLHSCRPRNQARLAGSNQLISRTWGNWTSFRKYQKCMIAC